MKFVEPEVYCLATPVLDEQGFQAFLSRIEAGDWSTDANSSGEILIEAAGKTCYRSFNTDVNPNLKKVRTSDNKDYIRNVLASKHGSVLEHVNVTFAFVNVSRIFTHELVRHRPASYSQESLRFVRLTELKGYFPTVFQKDYLRRVREHLAEKRDLDHSPYEDPQWLEVHLRGIFKNTFEYLEGVQTRLAELLELNRLDSFADKKKLTSAMRRLAPEGLATVIICTTNLRQWRHEIQLRTSRHAEEEIRFAFQTVYYCLSRRFPSVFQDAKEALVDGFVEVTFDNEKV